MNVSANQSKPKVYIDPWLGCQRCNPRPFSERKWHVLFPHSLPGVHPYIYDTWEEAIEAANAYRPPVMMNQTTGNTFTYTHTLPWINRHKWG